jgi:uncharacterized protein YceK
MKRISIVLVFMFLLTGCSKNPSDLACSVWEDKMNPAFELVDYWADLSKSRELTLDESQQAYRDQNALIAIWREMDSIGCKY